MKVVLLAVFAAFLAPLAANAGDAPPGKPAPKAAAKKSGPAKPDGRKTIGVISEIGDSFSVRKIGIMVFGNEENMVPVESWGFDALVAAKAAAILKARFNVIPIKLSKAGKAALEAAPSSLSLFGDRARYICDVLHKETFGQSFNYFLHVTKGGSPFGNTNQVVVGLGIVHRQGFDEGYTYVHAFISIEVRDGATCKLLRVERPESNNGLMFTPLHGPHREVEQSWFPALSSAAQNTRLRDATRELIEQGLDQSVPRLFSTATP